MKSLDQVIDEYCSAWSEPDSELRLATLQNVCIDTVHYVDPRSESHGVAQLSALINTVRTSRPGAVVRRTSSVDAHHGVARFAWQVFLTDGSTLPAGVDFVEIGESGRLLRIVGFFGAMSTLTTRTPIDPLEISSEKL